MLSLPLSPSLSFPLTKNPLRRADFLCLRQICKPNPVPRDRSRGDDHLSGTMVAHSLKRATKLALAPDRVYSGATLMAVPRRLLPHVFNLTTPPKGTSPCGCGGVFSVALSLGLGDRILSRYPGEPSTASSWSPLATILFSGVNRRVFGLSSPALFWREGDHLTCLKPRQYSRK